MAGKVLNIMVCIPLNRKELELINEENKLHSGLTGIYHAICHYSYNFPLAVMRGDSTKNKTLQIRKQQRYGENRKNYRK